MNSDTMHEVFDEWYETGELAIELESSAAMEALQAFVDRRLVALRDEPDRYKAFADLALAAWFYNDAVAQGDATAIDVPYHINANLDAWKHPTREVGSRWRTSQGVRVGVAIGLNTVFVSLAQVFAITYSESAEEDDDAALPSAFDGIETMSDEQVQEVLQAWSTSMSLASGSGPTPKNRHEDLHRRCREYHDVCNRVARRRRYTFGFYVGISSGLSVLYGLTFTVSLDSSTEHRVQQGPIDDVRHAYEHWFATGQLRDADVSQPIDDDALGRFIDAKIAELDRAPSPEHAFVDLAMVAAFYDAWRAALPSSFLSEGRLHDHVNRFKDGTRRVGAPWDAIGVGVGVTGGILQNSISLSVIFSKNMERDADDAERAELEPQRLASTKPSSTPRGAMAPQDHHERLVSEIRRHHGSCRQIALRRNYTVGFSIGLCFGLGFGATFAISVTVPDPPRTAST